MAARSVEHVELGRLLGEAPAKQVFIKICYRIADFDRTRDGLSWAFGLASYEIMSQRRRAQRRREVAELSDLPALVDSAASQEELLMQRELTAAFAQLVGELSEEDRGMLGLSATVQAVPSTAATLRKRRQRALGRLRALWRNLHDKP